jgi:phytanoyl-CoA hydroxylase
MSLLDALFNRPKNLTNTQREFWDTNGYLILKRCIKPAVIDRYQRELDELWENRASDDNPLVIDFWEGPLSGKRMFFKDAPDDSRKYIHKLNDLHFESQACRDLCLNPHLTNALNSLLGGAPLAIGTLTFEKGSEQENHFDTYYMPAPCSGEMVVSSIFLEKVGMEAGPVRVYPGSHLIPPYEFSDGNVYVSDKVSEMPDAKAYTQKELAERGIQEAIITGEPGDVLIWHGQLYHGGTPIQDHTLTRRSLVTHYWDAKDVESERVGTHAEGAHYLIRDHQPVPSENA